MSALPRFRVVYDSSKGPVLSRSMQVFVDGHDITAGVTDLTVTHDVASLSTVKLSLYAASVEMVDQARADPATLP